VGRWCMGRQRLILHIPLTCCESNRMLWASLSFRDPGRVEWALEGVADTDAWCLLAVRLGREGALGFYTSVPALAGTRREVYV
jgi:hypothetical protein